MQNKKERTIHHFKRYNTMKGFIRCLCSSFLLCLLLSGCGNGDSVTESQSTMQPEASAMTDRFTVAQTVEEGQELWTGTFVEWNHEELSAETQDESVLTTEIGMRDGVLYRLCRTYGSDKQKAFLEKWNPAGNETVLTELSQLIGEDFVAEGADVVTGGKGIILCGSRTDGRKEVLYTNFQTITKRMDLSAAMSRAGLTPDTVMPECFADTENRVYLRGGNDGELCRNIYVFDEEGNQPGRYLGRESEQVGEPFRSDSGELLFPVQNLDDHNMVVMRYDDTGKRFVNLVTITSDIPIKIFGMSKDVIYYQSVNGIVEWNISTGSRTNVHPISYDGYTETLIIGEEDQLTLMLSKNVSGRSVDWMVDLSGEVSSAPGTVSVISLCGDSFSVKNAATLAGRSDPRSSYQYQSISASQREENRSRIVAEMIDGAGPDLLYLSVEDFEIFAKKGLLADLKEVLPFPEGERILAGVAEMGSCEGKLQGIPCEIEGLTCVTLEEIWSGSTWTLDDIYRLAETGEYQDIFIQCVGSFAPRAVLNLLLDFELSRDWLYDEAEGKCNFTDKRFIEMLNKAKEFGDLPIDTEAKLGKGGGICQLTSVDFATVTELYEEYGEDLRFVGYPTDDGRNTYLTCGGILAVNRNCKNKEAVSFFLKCLLSDEIQYARKGISVLSIDEEDLQQYYAQDNGVVTWQGQKAFVKSDNTTSLDDYRDLLDRLVPSKMDSYERIKAIVWEEAQFFFDGTKDANAVATLIQNRVQLYLDE